MSLLQLRAALSELACYQVTAAKLLSIELCYLATIAFHLYQMQTTPAETAGPASFSHLPELKVMDVMRIAELLRTCQGKATGLAGQILCTDGASD